MRRFLALAVPALLLTFFSCPPADALVGGAQAVGNAAARPVVMIVASHGFCTGTAIARDLVLTAAHCVGFAAEHKLVEFDADRRPLLRDVVSVARHPQFSMQSLLAHRATADVAVLKLAQPLAVAPAPMVGARERVAVGERFVVHGYGLATRGDGKSGGTLRAATLAATGKPGNLQIRLTDPAAGERGGLGACTGDSGAPVFQASNGRLALIGVVSWSTGPGGTSGCGGLTGVTPIELYRGWIADTARRLGSPIAP